jgi:hypothetical protein
MLCEMEQRNQYVYVHRLLFLYAGRFSTEKKEEFYGVLGKVLSAKSRNESLFVCGDMNGHMGKEADVYHGVHGGNGFCRRNMEGELLLEFACSMDLVIANKMFNK